ncbi:oligosaccharide flippase family protein [Neorhodopirellula pilleata]|uniref:Colanic acid exporter n=1 Tax=Neorhodopirellula pilleata TaxID=2714738 RepID=A0A5C6A2J7_9BACT|nr:oligosaccharide flippase family protein [Neorhodopirellula pilleata]TWT93635.1 colanic acid exporter [Neorhodopirellula pilleata]
MNGEFKSKLLRGSTFSMAGTVLMLAVHFLSMKILAERMPVEEFGLFVIVQVISQGLVVVSGMGMALTLVKNISGDADRSQQDEIVTSVVLVRSLLLVLLTILVASVGGPVLAYLFGADLAEFVLFLPAMFGLAIFRETLFNILQGRQQFHWYAGTKVLSALTRLWAIIWLSHIGRLEVHELVWVEIITSAITVMLLICVSRFTSFFRIRTLRRLTLKQVIGFSVPLFLDDLFSYAYECVAVLLLGALMAPSSVALYAIAMKLPEAATRVLMSLVVVFFPSMSELMDAGRHDEGKRLMNLSLVAFSVGLSFIAITTFFFKEEVILVLFSEQYLVAATALALLMLNFVVTCLNRLMSSTAVAAGQSTVPLRVNVTISVVNVIACLALVPKLGIVGAALAQIVGNSSGQVLYLYLLKKIHLPVDAIEVGKPIGFGLLTVILYELVGYDEYWMRVSAIILYVVVCLVFVPHLARCIGQARSHWSTNNSQPSSTTS